MINLNEKQKVLLLFREGKSLRNISRLTGLHRNTVKKYIDQYEEKVKNLFDPNLSEDQIKVLELIDDITERPKYNSSGRVKVKVTSALIARIEFYLNENEIKRQKGMRKQQKRKIDIFEALKNEGFDISYSSVSSTINKILNKGAEAYIKQEYSLGEICEFDWGEVKVYIQGVLRTFQLAVFASAKGNYRYALLFPKQDTSCFCEAHALFFEHINGVYKTMVYDNMRVAVKKFIGLTEKEPTEALLKLSMYYGFNFRFCNIRSGNEKGHVERSVDYIRQKAFSQKDRFTSLEEANEYLLNKCEELNNKPKAYMENKTPMEILNEEREFLIPSKPKYDAAVTQNLRVDKYSTVTVNSSRYSVPEEFVGKIILVKTYSQKILCYYEENLIAIHERKLGFNEWSIKLEHYLMTLKKKPGALKGSTALHQANSKIKNIFNSYYIKKEKDFIELMQFMVKENKNINELEEAINVLKRISPVDITTEKIKVVCSKNDDSETYEYNSDGNEKEVSHITINARKTIDNIMHLMKNLVGNCTNGGETA